MKLIHDDCLTHMKTMASNSIDAIVTDPPFGIGKNYLNGKEIANTPEDYWKWFLPRYEQMLRILKPGGLMAIWQTQKYFKYFWQWFGADIHIYIGAKNFVQLRKTPINYAYDPVVMFYKQGGAALRPAKPKRNVDFFVANTAAIVSNPKRIERNHPYPRPLDLTTQIVDNFTLPDGSVFDPFMGSGTTGVACQETGRKFYGIELERVYYDLSKKRLGLKKLSASDAV